MFEKDLEQTENNKFAPRPYTGKGKAPTGGVVPTGAMPMQNGVLGK